MTPRPFFLASVVALAWFSSSSSQKGVHEPIIETEKLIVKGPGGSIVLDASGKEPHITLSDAQGKSRLELMGGDTPSVFLRSPEGEVVGALLTLQEGGAAVGLADKEGHVASLIRGGATPSLSFFQKSAKPSIALGIAQNTPHFLITSQQSSDNLLVHAGETPSLLFVDGEGTVSVILSKHGVYQMKSSEDKTSSPPSQGKIFTWEDLAQPFNADEMKFKSQK